VPIAKDTGERCVLKAAKEVEWLSSRTETTTNAGEDVCGGGEPSHTVGGNVN
jgi:hypothetical protein